jgi:HAD superfamily hydrolase (TIGR01509 family)
MIKGLIFDMDDTLVNSSPIHKESLAIVLKREGINLDSIPKKLESKFFGRKLSEIVKILVDYYKINSKPKEILERREKIALKLLKDLKPMPGLKKLIKFLRYSNYKIALASSSERKEIQFILKKFGMIDIFKIIVSGEEVKAGKPNPEVYVKAAKKLRLFPNECLVFEDSKNGITSAKEAGMKVVAVRNSLADWNQDLSNADIIIDNLEDVKTIPKKCF